MSKIFSGIFIVSVWCLSGCHTIDETDKTVITAHHTHQGDRLGHAMKDVIPQDQIPPSPILAISKALQSMQVQPGFVLENIVSEPNVFNPVALAIDADGRLWVAEMTRYMPDTFGQGEQLPEGNIAILEDSDDDGVIDKRTVFLSDIVLPRTIALVTGGILYADHTQLYFTEVLANLTPGSREVVDATYAKGGNLEHKTNTMLYGIDNWYYNAKSDKRYQALALNASLPSNSQEIYRNKYFKMVRGTTDYRGQWGMTMDDFGRLYYTYNSSPIVGDYLLPSSLLKNPQYSPKMAGNRIGGFRVYPSRMNPGVNRGYMDGSLVKDGKDKGKLRSFTAASGPLVYRGDNFPHQYYGMTLTPEPAANLISARHIIEQEGQLSGQETFALSELLTSTDERFRPVNLYNAPDGSVYILDMYHGILQHKEFLTTYLSKQIKARELDQNNNTMGRIYRLRWQQKPRGKQPRLSTLSSIDLVPYLAHPNGWWRDTSRRLIVQKNEAQAVAVIKRQLLNSAHQTTLQQASIINTLWTLHGLNAIDMEVLAWSFADNIPVKVKLAALVVSEKLAVQHHQQFSDYLSQFSQADYPLALYAAMAASAVSTDEAMHAMKTVLDRFGDKPWVNQVVLSGLHNKSAQFLTLLGDNYPNVEFMSEFHNLGENSHEITNREQLSAQGKQRYDLGKELYLGRAACSGCHGNYGDGITGLGPTFINSEWVVASKERLAKVLLHGLSGPISVNRQAWQTTAVMPGMAARGDISNKDLAAIATYIRNSWGNNADMNSEFTAQDIDNIRKKTQQRVVPYTAADIK